MVADALRGTYRFADVAVHIESLHQDVHGLCRAYRTEGEPDLSVRITQDDIEFERVRSEAADAARGMVQAGSTDGYLETLAVYRRIAEAMPAHRTVLVHGSCIAVDGQAYLFCAPSGTGKSTHVALWRELLGERALMVNDDKPLVRVGDDGPTVFGTPWDGKHHLSNNIGVPLRAVCLLGRDVDNHIERIAKTEGRTAVLAHVYRPLDPASLVRTLALVDGLIAGTDLWRLGCTKDIEAAKVAFAAMGGGLS